MKECGGLCTRRCSCGAIWDFLEYQFGEDVTDRIRGFHEPWVTDSADEIRRQIRILTRRLNRLTKQGHLYIQPGTTRFILDDSEHSGETRMWGVRRVKNEYIAYGESMYKFLHYPTYHFVLDHHDNVECIDYVNERKRGNLFRWSEMRNGYTCHSWDCYETHELRFREWREPKEIEQKPPEKTLQDYFEEDDWAMDKLVKDEYCWSEDEDPFNNGRLGWEMRVWE